MKVREVMTGKPVTVSPDTSVSVARKLMEEHGIRRLPVMRGTQLVGIVTQLDLMRASPSIATSLSVWEISYLLDEVQVKEVMTRNVVCVELDTDMLKAASLLKDHGFGALPVMDEEGNLVGIVTESDIFRTLVTLLEERLLEERVYQPMV